MPYFFPEKAYKREVIGYFFPFIWYNFPFIPHFFPFIPHNFPFLPISSRKCIFIAKTPPKKPFFRQKNMSKNTE